MNCLDLTLATPEHNLAADEALLDECEAGRAGEVLRFWESKEYFVVVGYANKLSTEVKVEACQAEAVPIRRRSSGGGTVVQGPGCLNYSLILRIDATGPTASITGTNALVMERHQHALQSLLSSPVHLEGVTDLVLGNRKFSGNAQRRRRNCLLFHGTFVLNFGLAVIGRLLSPPTKEPAYRHHRAHEDFVANLHLPGETVKASLQAAWDAEEIRSAFPSAQNQQLVAEKYGTVAWNHKF